VALAQESRAAPGTILIPSATTPLVTFRIQVQAGAMDDPPGKEGLNTLTALTIGEGGAGDLTYRQITERLDPMAASIHAQPDREVTTFVGRVHKDHLKEFQALLTALLTRPRFDPADFARVRDMLVASIETSLRGDDDETLGKEALNLLLYEGQPYGHPDAGTVQGLKSITLDEVKEHYRKFYGRGNVVLGMAGGYPPAALAALERQMAALPKGAARPRRALPEPRRIEGMEVLLVDKPSAASTAISIGAPIAVTRSDREFYALLVGNSCLGEHRTFMGRLMNVMRADRGLNYGDYSYIETFLQDGGSTFPLTNIPRRLQHFSIWIRPVAPQNAVFALRQATRELQRIVDSGLTVDQFEETRRYLLNYSRLWTQSLGRRLGDQLDGRFYGTTALVDRVQEELLRLKVEEVNDALRSRLTARSLAVAMVTDRPAELRETLLSGRPTPIVYQTPTTREDLLKEDREIEAYPLPLDKDRVRTIRALDLFER